MFVCLFVSGQNDADKVAAVCLGEVIGYPGPRGFLSPRREKRQEREKSGERKPLVAGDATIGELHHEIDQ